MNYNSHLRRVPQICKYWGWGVCRLKSTTKTSVITRIMPQTLQSFCSDLLKKAGSVEKEATIVASNLVESNLKGHDSHGVGYLPGYIRAAIDKEVSINQKPTVEIEHNFVRVDGKVCYGQVVGLVAIDAGIQVAKEHGMAIVTVKNSHHLGRIGAWAEQAVKQKLCSIHFTNVAGNEPLVAAHNGADARLGTNPITVGFPIMCRNSRNSSSSGLSSHPPPPIILDFATSELALGKVRETWARGELTKDEVLLDSKGYATNDPSVMFQKPQGALLPFSGHKGYAMAFICEMIGGILSGGDTIHPKYPRHDQRILNSMTTILFDPEKLCGNRSMADIDQEVHEMKEYLRDSPLRDDSKEKILIPGEIEILTYEDRIANGIPMPEGTINDLIAVANEIGLDENMISRFHC